MFDQHSISRSSLFSKPWPFWLTATVQSFLLARVSRANRLRSLFYNGTGTLVILGHTSKKKSKKKKNLYFHEINQRYLT
jgi:hypothetical protein